MVDLFNHQPQLQRSDGTGRGDGPSDCRPGGKGLAGQRLEEVDRLPRGFRKGFMGRTSRSRFRRFVSENFDGNIYI